jgi:hypothetical protein
MQLARVGPKKALECCEASGTRTEWAFVHTRRLFTWSLAFTITILIYIIFLLSATRFHYIKGQKVEVKKAWPKDEKKSTIKIKSEVRGSMERSAERPAPAYWASTK